MTAVAAVTGVRSTTGRFHSQMVAASVVPWCLVLAGHASGADVSVGLFALLGTVASTHVGVTAVFYLDPAARPILRSDPVRYFAGPALLFGVGVLLVTVAPVVLLQLAVAGLGVWKLHHFTKQNLGVFSFLARARGEGGPDGTERRVFTLTTVAAVFGVAWTLGHRTDLLEPLVGSARVFHVAGVLTLTAAAALVLLHGGGRARTLTLLGAVAFYAPLFVWTGDLHVAAAAYGAAHAAQYLTIMGHLGDHQPTRNRTRGLVVLTALTLGWYHAGNSASTTWTYGLFLGLAATHFLVDAGVWRLRQPAQRAYMRDRFDFL